MAGRRSNGEGTAYFDEKRQRWEGQSTYKATDGKTKRKKFTGGTQREVNRKKKEWIKDFDNGLLPEAGKLTVGIWLDRWLEDFVKPTVRTKTCEKYSSNMKTYIMPKFKDILIQKLSAADIQRLFNELLISGGVNRGSLL